MTQSLAQADTAERRDSIQAIYAHPHRHRRHHQQHLVREGCAVPLRAARAAGVRARARTGAGGAALARRSRHRAWRGVQRRHHRRDPAGDDRRGSQAHRAQGAAGHDLAGRLSRGRFHRAHLSRCGRATARMGRGRDSAGGVFLRLGAGAEAVFRPYRRRRSHRAVRRLVRHRGRTQARGRQLSGDRAPTGSRAVGHPVPVGRGRGTRRRARGRAAHGADRSPRGLSRAAHRRGRARPSPGRTFRSAHGGDRIAS